MPLSKLFHKRNSVKDKKAPAKPPDPLENKATGAPCDSVNEDIQSMAPESSESLALPTEPGIAVLLEKKSKEVSAVAEQLPPPKTEAVKDVPYESEDSPPTEQLKAENVQEGTSDCVDSEVRKEGSMATEEPPSTTETVIEVCTEVEEDGCTSTEQLSCKAEENTLDESVGNKDCALNEELSSETGDSLTCVFNEESSEQKGICDASLEIKPEVIPSEGSASAELKPLEAENVEDALSYPTYEETRSERSQSTEQSQKTGVLPNFKESDDASGKSGAVERSFPKETVEFQTKKGNVQSIRSSSSRSTSFRESGSKPNPPKSRRRKCESESAASNSMDDEGFDDKVLRFGVTDLEKMVGQCVNRLIRESIASAVRNVNVDSLCDEVLKSISGRSESESSMETDEQRQCMSSANEHADLELLDTFEKEESDCEAGETMEDVKLQEELGQEDNQDNISEGEGYFLEDTRKTTVVEPKDTSGYHADSEESLSVHSMIMETSNEVKSGGTPSVNVISSVGNPEESPGSSLLKPNKIMDSSSKQNSEEACVRNNTVDSLPTEDVAEVPKSDVPNEILDSSVEKVSEEESTSDISSEIVDSSLKTDSEEGSKSDITNEIEDSLLKKVLEENSVTDVTNDAVDSSLEKATREGKTTDSTHEIAELKQNSEEVPGRVSGMLRVESEDLISMCDEPEDVGDSDQTQDEVEQSPDLGANLPQQTPATDEEKKVKWKAGYLHVKLPHKSRGKGQLKAWKKRCVSIQPDEFAHSDPCLIVSVFSGSERKRGAASFWKSVSCQRAVVYRSSSSTQRYAFTVAEEDSPVVHLAADSEADAQGWMAAMRAVLWPPSPVVELEKMLNGSQFEVSLIDSEFSYRAGLLGMYGHLTITQKKLILVHPQQGYVIQEWYLNTVDKFELTHQTRIEDVHKVLCMTTCSDSSTGKGEILIFCREAVALLQSLASTIHQILTYHSKQEGGRYQKELEEIAEWLVPSTSSNAAETEEYYKVPPRQVRSLLDIPNFIFEKPLTPVASVACSSGLSMDSSPNKPLSEATKTSPSRSSQDSGISAGAQSADDFLNCSLTSFVVGGGAFHAGKSSDSELSDSYTPPMSPSMKVKNAACLKAEGDA